WQRPFDQQLIDKFFPLLKKAFRAFPPVIESPNNAWRTIRNRQSIDRSCRLGAFRWTRGHRLSVSSRTFIGLLAQTLSVRDFSLLFYRTLPSDGGPLVQFFRTLDEVQVRLAQVLVEKCEDDDDDWITFECGRTPH